jgi:glyoxylase-like metal-dependent hydrolase (beta-lactamase superfamily II)
MPLEHGRLLSRRGFCLCCVGASVMAAAGGMLTPEEARAEVGPIVALIKSEAAKSPIKVHQLRGNVVVFEGSGGNIAVLTGSDGKVLVDAGIATSRPQIETALDCLGPEPVTHLINTHWHFDHSDGNAWLNSIGAKILAHENTRKRLLQAQRVEDWSTDFPAPAVSALPTEVFAKDRTIKLNASTIVMNYYGPAHTDSDISVYFAEADILHAADTFWNGIYPFIDYSTGGTIDGSIRAVEADLAMTTDKTIIIPGHGYPVSNRAQLQAFRDMLVRIRENVAALKREDRALPEVVAARPTAAYDAKWGRFVIDPSLFTKLVYEGV